MALMAPLLKKPKAPIAPLMLLKKPRALKAPCLILAKDHSASTERPERRSCPDGKVYAVD